MRICHMFVLQAVPIYRTPHEIETTCVPPIWIYRNNVGLALYHPHCRCRYSQTQYLHDIIQGACKGCETVLKLDYSLQLSCSKVFTLLLLYNSDNGIQWGGQHNWYLSQSWKVFLNCRPTIRRRSMDDFSRDFMGIDFEQGFI